MIIDPVKHNTEKDLTNLIKILFSSVYYIRFEAIFYTRAIVGFCLNEEEYYKAMKYYDKEFINDSIIYKMRMWDDDHYADSEYGHYYLSYELIYPTKLETKLNILLQ